MGCIAPPPIPPLPPPPPPPLSPPPPLPPPPPPRPPPPLLLLIIIILLTRLSSFDRGAGLGVLAGGRRWAEEVLGEVERHPPAQLARPTQAELSRPCPGR
eukprot:6386024-Pyramimonas_sp.AAC.1